MDDICFYCDYQIKEGKQYIVTFLKSGDETDEYLCADCYSEWLEGIKE
jgi:hypothetical protein